MRKIVKNWIIAQKVSSYGERGLVELQKQVLFADKTLEKLKCCQYHVCAKAYKVKFNTTQQRTKETLDYVHDDLWVP